VVSSLNNLLKLKFLLQKFNLVYMFPLFRNRKHWRMMTTVLSTHWSQCKVSMT